MIVPVVSREEENNWTHEKWNNSVMKFCTGFQFETKKTLAALKQNAEYMAGGEQKLDHEPFFSADGPKSIVLPGYKAPSFVRGTAPVPITLS